jgi:hypothetical protein
MSVPENVCSSGYEVSPVGHEDGIVRQHVFHTVQHFERIQMNIRRLFRFGSEKYIIAS